MRLLRVHVIKAETCGGLIDGLDVWLRSPVTESKAFEPICLIGPNGSGKSQFLQAVAEMFQSVFHAAIRKQERVDGNPKLQFEVEYVIQPKDAKSSVHVRIARQVEGKRKPSIVMQMKVNGEWVSCELTDPKTRELLPTRVVGYTSGDNETLSVPFLLSRSGYADEVGRRALDETTVDLPIPDTKLMLIDYGTHLEVLVANLLLGSDDQRDALLAGARLDEINSFRCVVQLAHSAAPKAPARRKARSARKGIQLTEELEAYLDQMQRCSTCYHHDRETDAYIFDFLVDDQTRMAFRRYWKSTLDLYSAFHKLAMLNDLAIPKASRERFKKHTKLRRFASRLPEPQDENKVFRFERVTFHAKGHTETVDYVSISDGEHQLAQMLGTFCMVSDRNVLFLLDEPESHFNPQWRVEFISKLRDFPTEHGYRKDASDAAQQDCLLTTHAPFVASDTPRDQVFIFSKGNDGKVAAHHPEVETYGATFDAILEECFGVEPPISQVARNDIETLMQSTEPEVIKAGMQRLGHSVEKVFLADRLRELSKEEER
jgi:restriction system-associated AAA family ATPase